MRPPRASLRTGCDHRKQWIEDRLKELVGVFAVECAGIRFWTITCMCSFGSTRRAREWSPDEVVRRWLSLFPLGDTAGYALPVSQTRVEQLAHDAGLGGEGSQAAP